MHRSAVCSVVLSGVVAIVLLGAPACGGGDGGGGSSQTTLVPLYDVYKFSVWNNAAPPFGAAFQMGTGDHALQVSHVPTSVKGTFDTRNGQWNLTADTKYDIDTDVGPDALFGTFAITVTVDVVFPADAPPSSGQITIENAAFAAHIQFDSGGIELEIDGGGQVFLSFQALEDYLEDPFASVEQKTVAFAMEVLRFLIERYDHVIDVLFSLRNTDDLENGFNPRPGTCAPWPAGYALVPDTIQNPGETSLLWDDRDSSDSVNDGDDFTLWLWDCRPTADADFMYGCALEFRWLKKFVELGLLYSVGFAPVLARDGGVYFDGFQIHQVDIDDMALTVTRGSVIELNGAFAIMFRGLASP